MIKTSHFLPFDNPSTAAIALESWLGDEFMSWNEKEAAKITALKLIPRKREAWLKRIGLFG